MNLSSEKATKLSLRSTENMKWQFLSDVDLMDTRCHSVNWNLDLAVGLPEADVTK